MGLYKRKDSSFWWIKKTINGKTHYQSTKTTKKVEAEQSWQDFLNSLSNRTFKYRNKTWKNLVDYYAHNYSKNDHRFLTWTMRYWEDKKLSEFTNEDFPALGFPTTATRIPLDSSFCLRGSRFTRR